MAAKNSSSNGSTESKNDITRAYEFCGTLNEMAGRWESKLKDMGSIAADVHSSASPNGHFERGWHADGSVQISATFTIPMDIPAFWIEQMKQEFEEYGATVDIDVSASVTGRPPKQKESGVVVPRGPSQEKIDAMDESEKLHTGKVEVSMDITDQMQGIPEDLIIEGSRVSHSELGTAFVKSHHGEDSVYVIPKDQDQIKGRVVACSESDLVLEEQFPEETEESAWWHDV